MTIHRFDGVPIRMDNLSDLELQHLSDYSRARMATAIADIAFIDTYLQPTQEIPVIGSVQPELPYPPTAA